MWEALQANPSKNVLKKQTLSSKYSIDPAYLSLWQLQQKKIQGQRQVLFCLDSTEKVKWAINLDTWP